MTDLYDQAELSDATLVGRVVSGTADVRVAAFDEVYDRHSAAVAKYCAFLLQDPHYALDAASATFMTAWLDLTSGKPPLEPHKLRGWLNGIARNKCREERRRRGDLGPLPSEVEYDDYEQASQARQTEVDRILDIVVAGFTEQQQRVFRLSTRRNLVGQKLADALGCSPEHAYNEANLNIDRVMSGFGAYVLARDGRTYCPGLAHILDEYAWDGLNLPRNLRNRILRHLDTCSTCDDCRTCNSNRDRLIAPYAPVIIPILVLALMRHRFQEAIRTAGNPTPPPGGPTPPARRPSETPEHGMPRRHPKLRRASQVTGTAVLVAAVIVAAFLIRQIKNSPPGTPRAATGPTVPAPPQERTAKRISDAMVARRLAAFDISARNIGDPQQFNGKGSIDIASATTTRVRTLVQREQGEGHFWNPPTVVLIGDRAWVTPDNDPADDGTAPPAPTVTHPVTSAGDDQAAVDQAVSSRWMSSPANLALLLGKAASYTEKASGATFTFSGKASLESLVRDSDGKAFYGAYRDAPKGTTAAFTIVTDTHYLPASLRFSIPFHSSPEWRGETDLYKDDPFSVAYKGWGRGQPITAP